MESVCDLTSKRYYALFWVSILCGGGGILILDSIAPSAPAPRRRRRYEPRAHTLLMRWRMRLRWWPWWGRFHGSAPLPYAYVCLARLLWRASERPANAAAPLWGNCLPTFRASPSLPPSFPPPRALARPPSASAHSLPCQCRSSSSAAAATSSSHRAMGATRERPRRRAAALARGLTSEVNNVRDK